MNSRFQTLFHFVFTRPLLLQSTTTRSSTCSNPVSLQIAPGPFLHSSASLHSLAHCRVAHGFFHTRGTVLPLLLASLSHLVDHHRRSFAGGLPFRLVASNTTRFLLLLVRNFRDYRLHSHRACTSWGSQTKGLGPSSSETKCCAPAMRCGTPRIERRRRPQSPKVKDYNTHQTTNI